MVFKGLSMKQIKQFFLEIESLNLSRKVISGLSYLKSVWKVYDSIFKRSCNKN